MYKKRTLALGLAALTLGGVSARADMLIMEDGRRIRGDLVSINRGVVLFNEQSNASSRLQRLRLNLADIRRINMTDDDYDTDTSDTGGRLDTDRYGSNRPADRYGSNRGYDDSRRERVLTVQARDAWTNTGIDVREGDTLSFVTEGTVSWGPGRADTAAGEANSPNNSRRPISNRPGGALIGRIGNDTFFIGSEEGAFRARSSGRLYLGINDDHLTDNSGSFSVRVLH